jgi:CRISPR-associated endonuclease/helicase Cas3
VDEVYIAHSENEYGEVQLLRDHLRNTATLAREFGELLGLAEECYWAGLLHDLGKYEERFQRRVRGEKVACPHAPHGACIAMDAKALEVAFAVLAHHSLLRDPNALRQKAAERPAFDRNGAPYKERARAVLAIAARELPELSAMPPQTRAQDREQLALRTRMVFSALIDADRLDTERHGSLERAAARRHVWPAMAELADRVERYIARLAASATAAPDVLQVRAEVMRAARAAAEQPPGMATLTVPTGGGKTLASLLYALRHAALHNLRRVIVVVPYLAIIEQNVKVIREAVGESGDEQTLVLEHHSNVDEEEGANERSGEEGAEPQGGLGLWRRLATENWDAPIIVTTAVQFFESLFSARPGRVRKLHRIARSVVVFDEVQTFPVAVLHPILDALERLRREYGASLLFCTATQPALETRANDGRRWPAGTLREVAPDPPALFARMRRVEVTWPDPAEEMSWEALAERLARERQALVVVNTKRQALALFEAARALMGADAVTHLSARMCPEHRRLALDSVRQRLAHGEPCLVVSTQVVEAGVDLDFPTVYRALGPLDRIAQAAGRCNRNGVLRDAAGRVTLGRVVVFRPAEHKLPGGVYKMATEITETLLREAALNGRPLDIDNPVLFLQFFDRVYENGEIDEFKIGEKQRELDFAVVDEKFRVIDDDTVGVIVPWAEGMEIIARLRGGASEETRRLLRRAQRFSIGLYRTEFVNAMRAGAIEPLAEGGPYAALPSAYRDDIGFTVETDAADYIV